MMDSNTLSYESAPLHDAASAARDALSASSMPLYFHTDYTAPVHAFETTRKSAEIAAALGDEHLSDPSDSIDRATEAIANAHSGAFVEALRSGEPEDLAWSNGFAWDPGIWTMATTSTAGVMRACSDALDTGRFAGSLSSGLHHARFDGGGGFCTVNGLAVAALELDVRITILDFDAHCGGGTVSMLRHHGIDERVAQFDISTNYFDAYEPDATHFIEVESDDTGYEATVERILDGVVDYAGTDLLIYNAGTDPYPEISHECLARRDASVFAAAAHNDTPCAFVLAGGYTNQQSMGSLVISHLATIEAAALAAARVGA